MQWYEALVGEITEKDAYSRKELVDMLRKLKSDLSDGTYNWILGSLVSDGQLIRQGYDTYRLSDGISKKEYRPDYSGDALGVMNDVQNKYPYVRFTVFETVLMNEFLNHLIATTFSKAELPDVFEQAVSRYNLDKVRMFRYARRRNRQDEVKKYMGEQ